jgi:hypothetical protein
LKKSHDLVGVHEGWRGRKVVIVGSVVVDSVVVDVVVGVVATSGVHHLLLPRREKHKGKTGTENETRTERN